MIMLSACAFSVNSKENLNLLMLHGKPPHIQINIIQINCLQGTKYIDPDADLDCDLDNFAGYIKTGTCYL